MDMWVVFLAGGSLGGICGVIATTARFARADRRSAARLLGLIPYAKPEAGGYTPSSRIEGFIPNPGGRECTEMKLKVGGVN